MRKQLAYLAVLYEGDYAKIKKAILRNECETKEKMDQVLCQIQSHYVTILDDEYPCRLRDLKDPPFVLFYYGDLSLVNEPCLAMIGMRSCSDYGKRMASYFSEGLKNDFVIVSGMAKGIDGICHTHATKTIAVLGCGIDYCYPKENEKLYQWIKQNGLVLSEYPEKVKPRPYFFPWRNRIVAALGLGVVVIEASKKSGTMITVGYALDLGRSVFCVPGRIEDHIGTIQLIKEGAFCLESPQDILEELNLVKND